MSTSTPVKQVPPVTDSPGTWRHPRIQEITRRRNATTFSEKNVRRIAYNTVALLSLWFLRLIPSFWFDAQSFSPTFRTYASWVWSIAQVVPVVQILVACLPLMRMSDDLSDIPLSPEQRRLLGLSPLSAAPTPDAKYSTPPRYSRTPSISGSVASRGSYSGSPLSGRGSPAPQNSPTPAGRPASPMGGSPLLLRSNSGLGMGNARRSSLSGSGGLFGASTSSNLFPESSSGSPGGGKRTSIGLNSKWLYERGRRTSGSTWVQ